MRSNKAENQAYSKQTVKYIIVICLVFTVGVVLNGVFMTASLKTDATEEKLYTLSQVSRDVIEELAHEVEIIAVFSPEYEKETVSELLNSYREASGKIKVTWIDPASNSESGEILKTNFVYYGSITVRCEQTELERTIMPPKIFFKRDGVNYFDAENKITSAIKYVSCGREYKINSLFEHREIEEARYQEMAELFDRENISVSKFDLLKADCDSPMLMSAGPRQDYTEEEIDKINSFISEGGTFLLLLDSFEYDQESGNVTKTDFSRDKLYRYLMQCGIEVSSVMLKDKNEEKTGLRASVIEVEMADNELFPGKNGTKALMGESTVIKIRSEAAAYPVLVASKTAYAVMSAGNAGPEAPYCTAAAANIGKGKLIVASSSTLLTFSEALSNSEILLSIAEDAGLGDNSAIPAKPMTPKDMTINHAILKIVLIALVVAVMPSAAVFAAVMIRRRRKTGKQ